MEKALPPWLKAMQNGTIAEARSKAFLLDRFWVLERSVDIDGADFIIQRRITNKNILDREAPRLGVVQVKYFGTANTTHYVHKQYVVDSKNELRSEFFLICHTGDEEEAQSFLLTSQDINDHFVASGEPGSEKFRIPYDKVVTVGQFKITNRKRVLDRIEHQLELADFVQNRRFLSWALPSAIIDLDAILPIYREPIDNWWGDIPESFKELKETARSAMITVEEVYELLRKITEEADPMEAERIVEDVAYECRDGLGRWSIALPGKLGSPDFFTVCKQHREMVEKLKGDGMLDAFLDIKKTIREKIIGFITPHLPIEPNIVHRFVIHYDSNALVVKDVESFFIPATVFFDVPSTLNRFDHVEIGVSDYSGIDDAQSGRLDCHWLPGRYGFSDIQKENLPQAYYESDFSFYRYCLDEIYRLKYGDPLET